MRWRMLPTTLLLVATGACMSAPRAVQQPESFINLKRPERIWVTKSSGEQMVVDRPRLFGDTLFGHAAGQQEVWFPISQARLVEARQIDRVRTGVLIGAGATGLLYLLAQVAGSGASADRNDIDRPEMIVVLPLRIPPFR